MIRTIFIVLLLAGCATKKEPQNAVNPEPPLMQPKVEATAKKDPNQNTPGNGPKEEAPRAEAFSMADSANADPLASSSNAEITSGKLEIKGDMASEEVVRVIKKALPSIKFCYDEARQKNPSLSGKMKVSFVIASNGDVLNAKTKEGISSDLDECVSRKFAQFKFPPPGKGTVEVSYPLVFTAN
jgi:hypothetical protein